MITIQGFAKLCGCTTQTLRYYDRVGILKPAKVDEWTGYRYYEEEQALLFVKIKNLQQADFSIEEIKALLPADDDLLIAALEEKIEEHRQKLEKIREIQKSYLREKMDIQNVVSLLTRFMEGQIENPALWEEFGFTSELETDIRAKVHDTMVEWLAACREESVGMTQQLDAPDVNEIMEMLEKGNPDGDPLQFSIGSEESIVENDIPPEAQKVYECSGWKHVSEWINIIPKLSSGKQDYFLFRVRADSPVSAPGFPTVMLAVMDVLYGASNGGMLCKIARSDDDINHFTLMEM